MLDEPSLEPPVLPSPEGTVTSGGGGREARTEAEREGADAARRDRAEAGSRQDPDLRAAGGGPGDDVLDPQTLEEEAGRPSMTLLEHLEELRVRLLKSVVAVLLGAGLGWWFSGAALEWAIQPARRTGGARAGGFPGAEVILGQIAAGAPRRRVGLLPDGPAPMRAGTELFGDEEGAWKACEGGFEAVEDFVDRR